VPSHQFSVRGIQRDVYCFSSPSTEN
jgi:hypothetical protein